MREKLIELLSNSPYLDVLGGLEFYERAADHLIANGVIIPVRCKDCKHYIMLCNDPNTCVCGTIHGRFNSKPDDFCPVGVRKK